MLQSRKITDYLLLFHVYEERSERLALVFKLSHNQKYKVLAMLHTCLWISSVKSAKTRQQWHWFSLIINQGPSVKVSGMTGIPMHYRCRCLHGVHAIFFLNGMASKWCAVVVNGNAIHVGVPWLHHKEGWYKWNMSCCQFFICVSERKREKEKENQIQQANIKLSLIFLNLI